MLYHLDRQVRYHIAYPETWVFMSQQGSARFALNPLIMAEQSPGAGPMVFVLTGKVSEIEEAAGRSIRTSEALLEYTLEGLKTEQNPDFGPIELFESNLLQFAGVLGTYDDKDYQVRVKTYVVATVQGERALVAVSGSPEDEFDTYWPTFETMIRTLGLY
jgi:hypothetical protein